MPDVVIHYAMGQEVRNRLSPEIRSSLREAPYIFALYGPDPWFMYKPWHHGSGRGRTMHTRRTGAFLLSLAKASRRARGTEAGEQLFSYLAGFLCHYALDSATHPYIIWATTEIHRQVQSHRAFEHTLDLREMERLGLRKGSHPVVDHFLPSLQLPPEMRQELDAVYQKVYGWENAWQQVNRCYRLFRRFYLLTDNPGGFVSILARTLKRELLQAFAYSESYLSGVDVENNAHAIWHSAYSPEETFTTDFARMRETATERAVAMIQAVRCQIDGALTEAELRRIIGNTSYLSGLDVEDPRNWSVKGMEPADGKAFSQAPLEEASERPMTNEKEEKK